MGTYKLQLLEVGGQSNLIALIGLISTERVGVAQNDVLVALTQGDGKFRVHAVHSVLLSALRDSRFHGYTGFHQYGVPVIETNRGWFEGHLRGGDQRMEG